MKQINLLPKPKQQELRYDAVFYRLVTVIWVSIFSFGLVVASQFGAKLYMEEELKVTESRIAELQRHVDKGENNTIKSQVKGLNDIISDYSTLASSSPKWSNVLVTFAPLPPDDLRINSFAVDLGKKQVTINGFSPTRESVIELHDNILKDSSHFTNVDYPLENISKAKDINFHYTFTIKDDLLK